MTRWFGRRNRSRLKLAQSLGAFAEPGGVSPLYVFFFATNTGETDVELRAAYVEPEGGERLDLAGLLGEGLPHTLSPGEEIRLQARAKGLAGLLKERGYGGRPKVKLVVEDALGNLYDERFRFRVDEYLRLKDE